MFAPDVLDPTVDRLAALAGDGRALELAVGTGRVAIPLAARGVPVTGIEISRPMVARLREKADEGTLPVVVGDMATARAPGEHTLVYLVLNTIANLLTQDAQVECFRNAARHRYVWPAELDLMARLAGLELEARHAGWAGEPFTAESPSHVSVYRLPHAGRAT